MTFQLPSAVKWLSLLLAPPCATLPLNKGTPLCCLIGLYTARRASRETRDPERAFVTRLARVPDLPVNRRGDHMAT